MNMMKSYKNTLTKNKKMAKIKRKEFEFVASSNNGVLDIAVSEDINISIRDSKALYVTIGDWVYYIDDSTNEQIISKFKTKQ
jgi:hypothetical protein